MQRWSLVIILSIQFDINVKPMIEVETDSLFIVLLYVFYKVLKVQNNGIREHSRAIRPLTSWLLQDSRCSFFRVLCITCLQTLHFVAVLKHVIVCAAAWLLGIISLQLGHSTSSSPSSPLLTNYFSLPRTLPERSASTSKTCTSSSEGSPMRPRFFIFYCFWLSSAELKHGS